MDVLDDLFAMDEEEDLRIAEEKKKAAYLIESIQVEENEDQDWSENTKKEDKEVGKIAASKVPSQYDTKVKRVELGELVWAKTSWFKDQSYFPGRIAEITETTCEIDFPTSIPEDQELIEFFSGTKNDPKMTRFELVPKKFVKPYNVPMKGKTKQLTLKYSISKGSGKTDQEDDEESSGKTWDVSHIDNMRDILKKKYNVSIGNTVHGVIIKKAREFLTIALEKIKIETPIGEEDESYDAYKNKAVSEPEIDVFSLKSRMSVGRGVTQTITAGRWISFQHKIFKDKTVYVRVVEVTGDEKEPVALENDDVLKLRDNIRLLDEIQENGAENDIKNGNVRVEGKGGYVKGSGFLRPLKDYSFVKGKINVLSIQEELRRASKKYNLHEKKPVQENDPKPLKVSKKSSEGKKSEKMQLSAREIMMTESDVSMSEKDDTDTGVQDTDTGVQNTDRGVQDTDTGVMDGDSGAKTRGVFTLANDDEESSDLCSSDDETAGSGSKSVSISGSETKSVSESGSGSKSISGSGSGSGSKSVSGSGSGSKSVSGSESGSGTKSNTNKGSVLLSNTKKQPDNMKKQPEITNKRAAFTTLDLTGSSNKKPNISTSNNYDHDNNNANDDRNKNDSKDKTKDADKNASKSNRKTPINNSRLVIDSSYRSINNDASSNYGGGGSLGVSTGINVGVKRITKRIADNSDSEEGEMDIFSDHQLDIQGSKPSGRHGEGDSLAFLNR